MDSNPARPYASDFPEARVSRPGFEAGREVGRRFSDRIRDAVATSALIADRVALDRRDPGRLDAVIDRSREVFPDSVEEIRGLAEGAGVDLRTLYALNCMHLPYRESCSTCIYVDVESTGPRLILAHNEDHDIDIGRNAYLVSYDLGGGRWMSSHCHAGMIPGISFACNSYGLAVTCNSLPDPHQAVGMPRVLVGRSVMHASSVDEAIALADAHRPRSGGVSYNVLSLHEGRVVNIETTATEISVTEVRDRFFRTNHYLSPPFAHLPMPEDPSTSGSRYDAGIRAAIEGPKTPSGALEVLHGPGVHLPPEGRFHTTATALFVAGPGLTLSLYTADRSLVRRLRVL